METFIEILKAIVFGIVEGITEWLPVSSTGHMIILEQFFSFEESQGKAFFDFFLVIIQLGAIVAVVLSFFKELWPFGKNKSSKKKKMIWETWAKILIASIPAGVFGILFNDFFDRYLYNYLTVSITLIIYGIAFLVIEYLLYVKTKKIKERFHLNRESATAFDDGVDEEQMTNYPLFKIHSVKEISITYALIIGLAQVLALIPGTSRSGITIVAALLLSIDRTTAAKFSFYLSIPAMFGGSLIKGIQYGIDVFQGEANPITGFQVGLIIIAMVVAFVVSLLVVNFFMKMLRTRTFTIFGIYRIILGIVLLVIFLTVNGGNLDKGIDKNSVSAILTCVTSTNMPSINPFISHIAKLNC